MIAKQVFELHRKEEKGEENRKINLIIYLSVY